MPVTRIIKSLSICICISFFICAFSFAQELPSGYQDIKLGMSVNQVKEILKKNSIFGYRGDRDVSLLPTEERVLIETLGSSFLDRCWFQFYEDKLYAITLNINTQRMDYYSMFKTFTEKYGEPKSLNPKKSEWNDGKVLFILEKDLCVKYIDYTVYNLLIDKDEKLKSTESYLRENFLKSF